jgi:TPR repeat protein
MLNWYRTCLIALSVAIAATQSIAARADGYDDGMLAYTAGRYEDALMAWKTLAETGHARAQFNLAYMYEFGIAVPADNAQAIEWYRRSAQQGYARAQNFLGWMYEMGKGVEHNRQEALKWLRLAADQGSDDAQSDFRLVANRQKRQDELQFKQELFEAISAELERAQQRYDTQQNTLPHPPQELEASNHVS